MAELDDGFRGPPRAKLFFQGLFAPLPLAFVGSLPFAWVTRHGTGSSSEMWAPVSGFAFVFLGALGLTIFWWRRARWRSYGILVAFFAPLTLALLFFLLLLVSSPQLYPR
jgi:hypothetical protein